MSRKEIAERWFTIQDIIGPAKDWPKNIRKLFWTKHVNHWNRLRLSAFVYVNGLNPLIFLEWAHLLNLCRDKAAQEHLIYLFRTYPTKKYRLYAWSVGNNRYEYLDGTVHRYIKCRDNR